MMKIEQPAKGENFLAGLRIGLSTGLSISLSAGLGVFSWRAFGLSRFRHAGELAFFSEN